jgi:aconitate hydratase
VGGIEAEAAMLGQPMSMLIPQVLGFKLHGELSEGATATDLVLTVTELLREKGVVGMFVEFHGAGLERLPIADRATIGNMSPEFGSTCAIFPVDAETLRYLEFSGRPAEQIELVEAYAREQGLWHDADSQLPAYSDELELDLSSVEPSIAGPKRPQDRVPLAGAPIAFREALKGLVTDYDGGDEASAASFPSSDPPSRSAPGHSASTRASDYSPSFCGRTTKEWGAGEAVAALPDGGAPLTLADGTQTTLDHGHVVIAAITSCTNTSNPSVMVGAGILARNAAARGLRRKPWVKTSLAPGSKVVTEYLDRAGLTEPLEQLGFNLVGYGCTTCIGNSGPLPPEVSQVVNEDDLAVVSVLSGNRNFEGRINPDVKMNYLASPPLCVAYALAGTMEVDIASDPLGEDEAGDPVYLRDIWPSAEEVARTVEQAVQSDMFRKSYAEVFDGDERWNSLEIPTGDRYAWADSTYVRRPPFFEGLSKDPEPVRDFEGARVLALLGDSVTTDHISPAGSIKRDGPAGVYLAENGVKPADFNSYGSRRGNHEVMMRGTFANIRLRNELAPGTEGGWTAMAPGAKALPIYDAAVQYAEQGTPLVNNPGQEYRTGSYPDWAAHGTLLHGVRAVIAESFERIHRSILVGMGVLPLEFTNGETRQSLGLTGFETYDIEGLDDATLAPRALLTVRARDAAGGEKTFQVRTRIDTPEELSYYRHGGILPYVLRQLVRRK